MATPYALFTFDGISSTQDEAARCAGERPTLVVAARQSAGRGRLGRHWDTAPRALAASLAVSPPWRPQDYPKISLVAALAGRSALGEGLECKWPNDLLCDGEKVAGFLVEASGESVVVGMGVNLWWPHRPEGFGALFEDDPGEGAHLELAERWATELLARLAVGPEEWGHDEYRSVCRTIGETIRWRPDGFGRACDVDDLGRLVVETAAGVVRLSSGEVWEVR